MGYIPTDIWECSLGTLPLTNLGPTTVAPFTAADLPKHQDFQFSANVIMSRDGGDGTEEVTITWGDSVVKTTREVFSEGIEDLIGLLRGSMGDGSIRQADLSVDGLLPGDRWSIRDGGAATQTAILSFGNGTSPSTPVILNAANNFTGNGVIWRTSDDNKVAISLGGMTVQPPPSNVGTFNFTPPTVMPADQPAGSMPLSFSFTPAPSLAPGDYDMYIRMRQIDFPTCYIGTSADYMLIRAEKR